MNDRADRPHAIHPNDALHGAGRPLPAIAPCEHVAGNGRTIREAPALQLEHRGAFDVTCDCEDGAAVGDERAHAATIARVPGASAPAGRVGVRVHDVTHPHRRDDVELLLGEAGPRIAYLTLPEPAVLLAAQRRDRGPIDRNGELHDRASYRHCRNVLRRAHAAGTALEPAVHAAFFAR